LNLSKRSKRKRTIIKRILRKTKKSKSLRLLRRKRNRKESLNLGTIDLKPNERLDDLQRNGYRIIQDPDKFCFGMDAVLLSGFANAPEGGRCLDLGTGTGIIPILMAAKTNARELIGLEIQEASAEMANRSVLLNDLEARVKIVQGDIKEADQLFEAASFDVVTSNPPYMIGGHGLQNPDGPKAIARHEIKCDLEDVIKAAARCLKSGGKFYMVHRPFRLTEIMVLMHEYKVEPKRMRLVYPFVDKEPSMVLIEGARGGKPRITVEEPLIIYEEQGKYTREIYDIYGY
jgi:tRNA1Val (adenine37-N6)-methyltransferase